MSEPFIRDGDKVRVLLDREERRVLAGLLELLVEAGDAGGRLDYRAHPEDAPAEERYRELVGNSLTDLRSGDQDALMRGIEESTISLDEAESWMRVIGEARLVLAARLGITEDGWEDDFDPTQNREVALLGYLGYLQDRLVGVL